jgi:hypothetical protein
MDTKIKDRLFVILIIVVFIFVIFTVSYLIKNKEAFTSNPFIYGAKKMKLGNCNCVCFNGVNQQPISLNFNSTSLSYPNKLNTGGI